MLIIYLVAKQPLPVKNATSARINTKSTSTIIIVVIATFHELSSFVFTTPKIKQ